MSELTGDTETNYAHLGTLRTSRPDLPIIKTSDSRPSIIHQTHNPLTQEIHRQLTAIVNWLSLNIEYIESTLPIPEGLNHIKEITPFVYRQQVENSQEACWYSGFRISFKEFSGAVLVFNQHHGLTAETIDRLYAESFMPLSADLRIILPQTQIE